MKTFFILIITFMSFSMMAKITAQQKLFSNPEIKNYIDYIETLETNPDSYNYIKNTSSEEIKKVASLMYKAFDKDYIGLKQYRGNKNKEWGKENGNKIKKQESVTSIKFGGIEGILWDKIENILGKGKLILIRVPFLLKVKIENIQSTKFHNTVAQIVVNAKVLEILKGNNNLSVGDNITFYYMKGWRITNYNFHLGETVFVAIEPRSEGIALVTYNDNSHSSDNSFGRYPIENGILIDKNNAWGYGKNISWQDFKVLIKQDINNIVLGR
ncbi:MAG: hypothetical protein P4L27_00930 [Ignavibacteriaceae bacterium]|nr:hypothetical protein [Ignavibacteriaceae bacterium]